MNFIDLFENGTVAKLRSGKLITHVWVKDKLCEVSPDGRLSTVNRNQYYYADGRIYPKKKMRNDIMEVYAPKFDEFGRHLSPEELIEKTTPIWVRQPILLTEREWLGLKVDTPIIVSEDGINWVHRFFYGYSRGIILTYPAGRNSWTDVPLEKEEWKYGTLPQ